MKMVLGLTGIVAHDAGGAELLSSYVQSHTGEYLFAMKGPAISVFDSEVEGFENSSLETVLSNSRTIITGSGWQSDFEWDAIGKAKERGTKVITFLDSWENYESRFVRNSVQVMPDEIWVSNATALALARVAFLGIPVTLIELFGHRMQILNAYRRLSQATERSSNGRVLFLSDNVAEAIDAQGLPDRGYTDLDSLDFLIANLGLVRGATLPITVRPHPSEQANNWKKLSLESGGRIVLSETTNLLEDFSKHEFVAGSNSNALAKAIICGKRAFCAVRDVRVNVSIPSQGIVFLRDFV
jgi:hypothetical protein